MQLRAAGNVFWASFLVLFPVAGQLSAWCVTYQQTETCGLKGLSVEFPCSYPRDNQVIRMSGWGKNLHSTSNQKKTPSYSLRMKYLHRGANDCTAELTDLKETDASIYYFQYDYRNVAGKNVRCNGYPGVRLHIFASPVSILVENIVRGQRMPVADHTVIEGQRIMLTCVPSCAVDVNSNPGYIWYKDRLHLTSSRAKSPFLTFDSIRNEDTGNYFCAMIGYENLTSYPVNLTVQRSPRNTVGLDGNPGDGSKKGSEATLTHDCDVESSVDQHLNDCQAHNGKSISTFSTMFLASVCAGLVVTITVTILALIIKMRSNSGSAPHPLRPTSDPYVALNVSHMSAEYDTLDSVRQCLTADTHNAIYENLPKHQCGNR